MGSEIKKRSDINPDEGLREYGDVEFADPVNHKYPVDNPKHIMAAWRYIQMGRDRSEYSKDEVNTIEQNIIHAAEEHGMHVWQDSEGNHISED